MKSTLESYIVPEGASETRLERYVFDVFNILPTKKSARKAIKRGDIRVNGEICSPGTWIKPGQHLEFISSQKNQPKPFQLPLRILYEDEFLAVVEKPPGIAVSGNRYRTIENALLFNLKKSDQKDSLKWPKPVHRLDICTGGLLIAAKTMSAQTHLGWQFQKREVNKRYRAIVIGKLEGKGSINIPIEGRDAETEYDSLDCTPSLKNDYLTLIDLWPITGRTHQLRRHMAGLGFPILGDKEYGIEGKILKSKGLFLWAVDLRFIHPITESLISIKIDEPDKFASFMQREKRRWEKYN